MKQDDCDSSAAPDPTAGDAQRDGPPEKPPGGPASPVRVEKPPVDEEEMGGEAPCQAHQFWDLPE